MTAKKKIILTVITCFLLDSSVAFSSVELPVDSPARAVAPAVFQLVSLIRLPFSIVAGLTQEFPLFPGYEQPSVPKPSPHRTAGTGKDSICPDNPSIGIRAGAAVYGGARALPAALLCRVQRPVIRAMNSPDTGPRFVFLALLVYLAILLTSNLPWEAVSGPFAQARSRVRAAGLFYLEARCRERQ